MLKTAGRYAGCQLISRDRLLTLVGRRYLTDDTKTQDDAETIGTAAPQVKSPITGLLAQHAALEKHIRRRIAALKGRATRLRLEQERQVAELAPVVPRAATSALQPHHDLGSFLDHAEEYNLRTTSTVFKGTLYEYTVAEALKAYNLSLNRVGKANDLGIDLLGRWVMPQGPDMRVLIQCKLTKTTPAIIRELEGTYVGAPAGWQGDDVLALLATRHAASPGTQQAIQRSKWPLGFVQIDVDGVVRQFIWNAAAAEAGLSEVGVSSKHSASSGPVETSIVLTWKGDPWPAVAPQSD